MEVLAYAAVEITTHMNQLKSEVDHANCQVDCTKNELGSLTRMKNMDDDVTQYRVSTQLVIDTNTYAEATDIYKLRFGIDLTEYRLKMLPRK